MRVLSGLSELSIKKEKPRKFMKQPKAEVRTQGGICRTRGEVITEQDEGPSCGRLRLTSLSLLIKAICLWPSTLAYVYL